MFANFLFLTCALLSAQNPPTNLAPNAIRLERGHELFYRGQFLEESLGGPVQFRHAYRMELRVLVLDANPKKGLDLAFYTIVKKTNSDAERGEPENCSVRLELAKVDLLGRLTADKPSDFLVPLDGPATLESGVFVETPEGPLQAEQWWRVGDDMRPDRTWRCLGLEVLNGISCLKMEGIQQSDDWDRPRARPSGLASQRRRVAVAPLWHCFPSGSHHRAPGGRPYRAHATLPRALRSPGRYSLPRSIVRRAEE